MALETFLRRMVMTKWMQKALAALALASFLAGCSAFPMGSSGVSDPALYERSLSD